MNRTISKHSFWERAVMSVLILCIAQLLAVSSVYSQNGASNVDVPKTISYQGLISLPGGSVPQDGTYPITVSLYADDSGATTIWSGNYTTAISRGIFNIILGSGSDTLPAPSLMNRPIWVGVSFNGNPEARPLSQLSAAPYALNVPDQSISAAKISANYVGSISVNGKTITKPGSNLNIVQGNGVQMSFDSISSTLFVNSNGTDTKGGMNPLWIGYTGGSNVDGQGNTTPDYSNTIGGGYNNTANPYGPSGGTNGYASILGGSNNEAGYTTQYDVVGGGYNNTAVGGWSTIAGGSENGSGSAYASVGGGANNAANNIYGTIGGGNNNVVGGGFAHGFHGSTIGGGEYNVISGTDGAIPGGAYLKISSNSFGFNNSSPSAMETDVSMISGALAYFGNVNLNIGNTDGTAGSLVLWGPNTTFNPSSTPLSTSITAGMPTASVTYTLPSSAPPAATGYFLTSTTTGGMSWTTPGAVSGAWLLTGNPTTTSGDFLGTETGGVNLQLESVSSLVATFDGPTVSVILGDASNSISGSPNHAAIGGGYTNSVSANYGAVPGGQDLTSNDYAEAVVGLYNNTSRSYGGTLPTYPKPPQTQASNAGGADDPLFVVGNGVSDTVSNAFEVSYNGHATPTQVFGNYVPGGPKPIKGAYYNDNALNAWGQVDYTTGSGAPTNDFGTKSADWISSNTCAVTLNCPTMMAGSINTASITVTGEQDTCPSEITGVIICQVSSFGTSGSDCKPGTTTFYVSTYWLPIGGGSLEAIPEPFFYKVAGR